MKTEMLAAIGLIAIALLFGKGVAAIVNNRVPGEPVPCKCQKCCEVGK